MTKEETTKIIFMIKSTYPKTYEKFSDLDFQNMLDMWAFCFEEYDYRQISLALKAYITSNTSGFPPVPGQLIQLATQSAPKNELTSNEAWDLVYKAICNSNYNAEEEYNNLPELCQKAIGSPASLRELAAMDIHTVMAVEGSHFKRNYETLVKRQQEYEKIPESTRILLEASRGEGLLEIGVKHGEHDNDY